MSAKSLSPKYRAGKCWVHLFIRWSGALLLALALVNLINAGTSEASLIVLDPLLGIPFRLAVLVVGGLELVVALICLFGCQAPLQSGLIAMLVTNFMVYRVGLLWQGCPTQWGCLGNPLDQLKFFSGTADEAMFLIFAFLLVGSCVAAVWLWLHEPDLVNKCKDQLESLKIACPDCGVHIGFAGNALGQKISCPHCHMDITLKEPA